MSDGQGSGDFDGQANERLPLTADEVRTLVGAAAENDMSMAAYPWTAIPEELATTGCDALVYELMKRGWRDVPVVEVAVMLGICYPDGSWT